MFQLQHIPAQASGSNPNVAYSYQDSQNEVVWWCSKISNHLHQSNDNANRYLGLAASTLKS